VNLQSSATYVHDAAPSATEHLVSLQLVYGMDQSATCRPLCVLFERLQEASEDTSLASSRHTAADVLF